MAELQTLLSSVYREEKLIQGTLSKLRSKESTSFSRVTIRPVLIKKELHYQFTYHYQTKELHENLKKDAACEKSLELLETAFRQGMLFCEVLTFRF